MSIMEWINENIVRCCVLALVAILLCLITFSLLHVHVFDSFVPNIRSRQSFHFSREELYQNLWGLELTEDGVITSLHHDPQISVNFPSAITASILMIDVSNLSTGGNTAQIFYAGMSEALSEERSVRFILFEGLNIIYLPYLEHVRLRLDLAESADISMIVNYAFFGNYYMLPLSFGISYVLLIILVLTSALSLYLLVVMKFKKKSVVDERNSTPQVISQVLFTISVTLMPNIFWFNLYNHNFSLGYLNFTHLVIWAFIFSMIGVALFYVLKWVTACIEIALIVVIIFWFGFWFFGSINSIIRYHLGIAPTMILFVSLITIVLILSAFLVKIKLQFNKISPVFNMLSIGIIGLSLFAIAPSIHNAVTLQTARAARSDDYSFFKMDFYIDSQLSSPNIYWLWLDGLISPRAAEQFFEISQDHIREGLVHRGFVINEDAVLLAGNTAQAAPALFSPGFYDNIYGEIIHGLGHLINTNTTNPLQTTIRHAEIDARLRASGVTVRDMLSNLELIKALSLADYTMVNIGMHSDPIMMPFCKTYVVESNTVITERGHPPSILRHISSGDLGELVALTTPISLLFQSQGTTLLSTNPYEELPLIPEYIGVLPRYMVQESRRLYLSLIDSLSLSEPRFIYMQLLHAHSTSWRWQDPGSSFNMERYYLYPLAHMYALEVMFNLIDIILGEDPYAVIILQSDHGIKDGYSQIAMIRSGFSYEDVLALQNQVFSAVRIPSRYGGLYTPLAPLNISRELVNRYVGPNYPLLP